MPLYKIVISQIACGDFHTLALEANGQGLWAWGSTSIKAGQFNKGQCGFINFKEDNGFNKPMRIEYFSS